MTPLSSNLPSAAPPWGSRVATSLRSHFALGYLVLGALAAYLYLGEHRAHFVGALPFLLLLACPLMHLFMHHGHGGHGGHRANAPPEGPGGPK